MNKQKKSREIFSSGILFVGTIGLEPMTSAM